MTRIFEALKKSRVTRPATTAPPLHPVRSHGSAAVGTAQSIPAPERLGLVPRPSTAPLELTEDVIREMTGLRMTLETALGSRAPRVVLFTSAQSGEGTSTVVAQFAGTLVRDAQLRVLLVDLNARRPSPFVEGRLQDPATHSVSALAQADTSASARLDVLPVPTSMRETGVIPSAAARDWVDALGTRYDWIVLDGPAVLEAPDAPGLAGIADGTVIVVEAGRTKRPVLHRATDLLRKARANLIGSVLNRRRLEIPEFLYRRI